MSYFSGRIDHLLSVAVNQENFLRKDEGRFPTSTYMEKLGKSWEEIVNYVGVINSPAPENLKLKASQLTVVETEELLRAQIRIDIREALSSQEIQIRVQNSINVINAWTSIGK